MVIDFSVLKKILIIRLSSIGDILLTTPLIRSIKRINPSIEIDFVLKEEYAELIQLNPYINNLYKYTKHSFEKQSLINSLVSAEYNLAIDLQNNMRSKEITRPLHCRTIRFNKKSFRKFLLVHFKINRLRNAGKIPERYADAVKTKLDEEGLDFFTDSKIDSRLNSAEKYIGLCPGAKHFTKRWPKDYFIELGKKLESAGYKVVLFGGKDETQLCSEIEKNLNQAISLSNTNLLQVGADMQKCKAVYTNDSGLMHLATALKIPVVAIFGSTVEEFGFFPYKARSEVLQVKNLRCRPCTHIGRADCPKKHFLCMREIKPELAYASLEKLMVIR